MYEPNFGEIDYKVFSPMNSHFFDDLPLCMDSPYASDFGHDQNGFHFQDGTSKEDVSFSLLDEVSNNHDDSCEESNTQKNSVAGTEMPLSGNAFISKTMPPETSYLKENGIYSDTDTEMSQLQVKNYLATCFYVPTVTISRFLFSFLELYFGFLQFLFCIYFSLLRCLDLVYSWILT